jgi:hypothetical protein
MKREREVPDVGHPILTPHGAGRARRDLARPSPTEFAADLGCSPDPPAMLPPRVHPHARALRYDLGPALGRQPPQSPLGEPPPSALSPGASSRCCLANTVNG